MYVDEIKLAGKKHNIDPMWKSNWEIQHHSLTMLIWVALNENAKRAMILWTLNPGSLQELQESYLVQGNLTQTSLFIWIRLPRHKWPKSWSSMEDPVVLLEPNLYGHPLAGLSWERQFEKILLQHG